LVLTQTTDPEKEKRRIAIQLAKKEFIETQLADSVKAKLTTSDLEDTNPNLLAFIRKTIPAVDSIGLEKACEKRLDANLIESRFQALLLERNNAITIFLTQTQGIPTESVQVLTADLKNLPEELKVPQFKIEVSMK